MVTGFPATAVSAAACFGPTCEEAGDDLRIDKVYSSALASALRKGLHLSW